MKGGVWKCMAPLLFFVVGACRGAGNDGDGDGDIDADADGDADAGDAVGFDTDSSGDGSTGPDPCEPPCLDGQVCNDGTCVDLPESCPCPLESYCDLPTNSCEPGCRSDQHCSPDRICLPDRTCRNGCREDSWCNTGQICDDDALTCRSGCRGDEQCSGQLICDVRNLTCREGCRVDEDCDPGQLCDGSMVCAEGCQTSATCPDAHVCDSETCVPVVCDPGMDECAGEVASTCNNIGSAYLPEGMDCASDGQVCHQGRCVLFYDGFVDGSLGGWESTDPERDAVFSLSELGAPIDLNSMSVEGAPEGEVLRKEVDLGGRDRPSYMSFWFQINSEADFDFRLCFGEWDSDRSWLLPVACIFVPNQQGDIMDDYDALARDIGDRIVGAWHHVEVEPDWETGRALVTIDGTERTRFADFSTARRVRAIMMSIERDLWGDAPLPAGTVLVDGLLIEE